MTLQALLLRVLPLPAPGRVFADGEWRTLTRIAEALLQGTAVDIPMADVADNVELFLARGRSRRAWRIRALLHLVEWTPLFAYGKPLSKMTLAERRRVIEERFVDGRMLWGVCAKIRYLVLLGAYGDPRAHAPTGYVPVSKRRRFLRMEKNGGSVSAS